MFGGRVPSWLACRPEKRNGFDVLDIDGSAGRKWYFRNCDALPPTRVHYTQRGVHIFFNNAPGLRCSTSRIAPSIDVKAEGGYVIWHPREGLPIEDAGLVADWPEWLLAEAMRKPRFDVYHSTSLSSVPVSVSVPPDAVIAELTTALFQLDPCEWRSDGDQEGYLAWLGLMMACKAAGIAKEDWLEWCALDECYADAGEEIGRKWDGAPARHSDALFKALAQAMPRVRLSRQVAEWRSAGAHISAKAGLSAKAGKPPANLQSRSSGLMNWLSKNLSGDGVFSAACLLAELNVTQATATKLILGNFPSLRKSLGEAEVCYQIGRAFDHINAKRTA
jgi:Bifunctional DNA primase/polymerase, N-terminal/Primase C terminal 2 (PriCT-2)